MVKNTIPFSFLLGAQFIRFQRSNCIMQMQRVVIICHSNVNYYACFSGKVVLKVLNEQLFFLFFNIYFLFFIFNVIYTLKMNVPCLSVCTVMVMML